MTGPLLPAGSTAWLVAHELRLSLRPAAGAKRVRVVWIVLGLFMLAVMGLLVFPALKLRTIGVHPAPLLIMVCDLAMVAIFTGSGMSVGLCISFTLPSRIWMR